MVKEAIAFAFGIAALFFLVLAAFFLFAPRKPTTHVSLCIEGEAYYATLSSGEQVYMRSDCL